MSKQHWIFLGGPIMHAVAAGGYDVGLRSALESVFCMLAEQGFEVRSALSEGYLEHGYSLRDEGPAPHCQAQRDHQGVVGAACYVALWPSANDAPLRSDGLCVELGWATQAGVPCVLVRDIAVRHSDLITGLGSVGRVEHLDYHAFLDDRSLLLAAMARAMAS